MTTRTIIHTKPVHESSLHSDDARYVTFGDGAHALFKPMLGGNIAGEVLAYQISNLTGFDVVPPTAEETIAGAQGSVQEWVEDATNAMTCVAVQPTAQQMVDIAKIVVLDMIMGQNDRHGQNIVCTRDHMYAIDNESWGGRGRAAVLIEALAYRCGDDGAIPPCHCPIIDMYLKHVLKRSDFRVLRTLVQKYCETALELETEIMNMVRAVGVERVRSTPLAECVRYVERNFLVIRQFACRNI